MCSEFVWAVSGLQVHVLAAPAGVSRMYWDMSGVLAAEAAKESQTNKAAHS